MVTQQKIPETFQGSLPEYIVLTTLSGLGRIEGEDFTYQSSLFGGRLEKGGLVIDFLFYNPPDLAINVQGIYYHSGAGPEVSARDRIARDQLAAQGTFLIFIDEDDALQDADFFVREALQFVDHSRVTRGG